MKGILHLLVIFLGLAGILTGAESAFPDKPIRVIVPFSAGGGSDTFVRLIQKAVEEEALLPQPLVVINVPGAGGTIGSRKLKDEEPDGYTIMCLHEAILTAKYAGNADYGPEAFEAIAGTGEIGILLAAAEDSPYENLRHLMNTAAERPYEIVFATNIGAPSHYVGLLLEGAKEGARFRYTQSGGGAKRFHAIHGGHSDVSVFSLSEFNQFKSAGIQAMALCTKERHPNWPDMPTATEQGFDVVRANTHFWWAPKGTPSDHIEVIANALQKAMNSPSVQARLKEMHTDPTFLTGAELKASLAEREKQIAGVDKRESIQLPNFPMLSLGVVIVFALIVAWQSRRSSSSTKEAGEAASYPTHPGIAIASLGITAIYIWIMQKGWLSFPYATLLYIFGLGMLLTRWDRKKLPVTAAVAAVMAFGLYYSFTRIFVIDLP